MFGEDESESPRVPSPWDSLSSSPSPSPIPIPNRPNGTTHLRFDSTPSPPNTITNHSPLRSSPLRLPPECDTGNIEYKLHLLHPSTPRFTRLVTQLKWRLLEGGGQAYYELGVSDDGDLVGLSVQDLEGSLETLEMMAGEIGASVVVVKEVEVVQGTGTTREGLKADISDSNESEFEFEFEDEYPSTSTSTSSASSTHGHGQGGVEISSVFKPRPVRIRSRVVTGTLPAMEDADKVATRTKPRLNNWRKSRKRGNTATTSSTSPIVTSGLGTSSNTGATQTQTQAQNQAYTLTRRQARDRRRAEKRLAFAAAAAADVAAEGVTNGPGATTAKLEVTTTVLSDLAELNDIDTALTEAIEATESLHITSNSDPETDISFTLIPPDIDHEQGLKGSDDPDIDDVDDVDDVFPSPTPFTPFAVHREPTTSFAYAGSHSFASLAPVAQSSHTANVNSSSTAREPRLIVEALVVRKLDLSEAFLDFGGFGVVGVGEFED